MVLEIDFDTDGDLSLHTPKGIFHPETSIPRFRFEGETLEEVCVKGILFLAQTEVRNPYSETYIESSFLSNKDYIVRQFQAAIYDVIRDLSNFSTFRCSCHGENRVVFAMLSVKDICKLSEINPL